MTLVAVQMAESAEKLGLVMSTSAEDLLAPVPDTAAFDHTESYRYLLTRTWGDALPLVFVMLNPSTADAFTVDPTVTRCIGFARDAGAGGLIVLNAFALCSTDPKALYDVEIDPVGACNDAMIDALPVGPKVIAAWGVHGSLAGRGDHVLDRLTNAGHVVTCLGLTDHGHPRHPLYMPKTSQPFLYAGTRKAPA